MLPHETVMGSVTHVLHVPQCRPKRVTYTLHEGGVGVSKQADVSEEPGVAMLAVEEWHTLQDGLSVLPRQPDLSPKVTL